MEFRPCIDLHDGKVKQIVGSTLGSDIATNFTATDGAAAFGAIFDKYDLSGGHICVLDRKPSTLGQALLVLGAFPDHWQVGGGINEETACRYLDAGAEQVIVSSALFDGDDIFEQAKFLSQRIGCENLVLDLSCKAFDGVYYVMKDGWRTKTNFVVNIENLTKLSDLCAEFLVHGVSVEGRKSGFDVPLVELLSGFRDIDHTPITYAGGLNSLDDIQMFAEVSSRQLDFTIGSSLDIYGGHLSLDEILELTSI